MPSMPPPKYPASYQTTGIGSGGGFASLLPGQEASSMDAIASLGMDTGGIDLTPLGLDTTGVLDFANMDMVDWATFGV